MQKNNGTTKNVIPLFWQGMIRLEVALQPRLWYPTIRHCRGSLVDHGASLRSLHLPPAALATSPGTHRAPQVRAFLPNQRKRDLTRKC